MRHTAGRKNSVRRIGLSIIAATLVSSLRWIVPIIAIPLAMIATRLAHWLDPRLQWTFLGFGVKGAEALLQATVTATLSFLAFTFASLWWPFRSRAGS